MRPRGRVFANSTEKPFVAEDSEERYVRYGDKEEEWGSDVAVARTGRFESFILLVSCILKAWCTLKSTSILNLPLLFSFYKVGSESKVWSTTRSFVSLDKNSNETVAFLFGDMGTATPYITFSRTQDESISTVKWILRDIEALGDKPTFVSHIGDISYARGYSWLWDEFFNLIEPVASKVPYHVCIGNHEYDWPSQPWKPDWANSIYGTDGAVNVVFPIALDSICLAALKNQLEPVLQLPETFTNHLIWGPFILSAWHRPMYTTSFESKDAPWGERMLEHLEPLLVKNKCLGARGFLSAMFSVLFHMLGDREVTGLR
ncbi:hepatoma-derived growth factor-related protein 2-like isoform X1 [Hibiscus syriacus]|uniref:Hepatoma-derived growth factor-related protein 2-like isoform X1 n=1 Tax=Hibiscus syriacus TaxID=106335 RepID=A0A6A3CUG4_HIBSY|nr:hepatoma-derived growth factor-related protein 2-like isoform X1 [Hibiscus syriacus]